MSATYKHIPGHIGKKLGPNADGDLQVCFGSNQMGQSWYFITNASAINKWARYKPFRHPNGANYSDHYDDLNSARLAAAASVNYGLSAPAAQQNFLNTFGSVWSYNPCINGDPLETWDFEGYNGEAEPPVDTPGNIDVYMSSGADFSFGAYIRPLGAGYMPRRKSPPARTFPSGHISGTKWPAEILYPGRTFRPASATTTCA